MNKVIAYLAPEIPSVSGTFVYNEILALKERGLKVIPISIHPPNLLLDQNPSIEKLLEPIFVLYSDSFILVLFLNLQRLLSQPKRYFSALLMLFGDLLRIGLFKINSLKLIYHFLYASKVARIMSDQSCNHLHTHFAHFPTQIGMYASALSGASLTFTSHANDLFENNLLLKEKSKRAKSAVTISDYNRLFLESQGVDKSKIKIVRCGVNTSAYKFRGETSFSKPLLIGSLGRLVEKKGFDTLINALAYLYEAGVDFQLEICGDGPLKSELESLVERYSLYSKIKFRGAISHNLVPEWLESLDLFILACKEDSNGDKDGIPVALMEAMAIGVPVISTRISGIPELINDGVSGFIAEPNNPRSVAESIKRAVEEESLFEVTVAARKQIEQEFDKEVNVRRLIEVFTGD